jgi:hypothetical protein
MKFKTPEELRAFLMGMCHERANRNEEVMRECGHGDEDVEVMRTKLKEAFDATYEEALECLACAKEAFEAHEIIH